ncbi:transcription antitermination factor NusB [Candidatus Purcelliella pentastirinorum]|uniref:Transcription antitermination protein NusB n=1 Tax=Candidatus Purcelliella pentastirinorum TaxID=472834 RepID=A0A346E0A3_9ENTR|nr:transcription antitermination factor NusB [Candidatus Purcelliella pentastirinorum]AXN02408.1 Transcription termination protein NusB [Candidatus Purcelliella pentastirinorum]WDI78950.1 transcription antitermination factor NusB [Candidatus Purcelliella pentastirinorum]WDR80086.1 transcription antitermination factor NusB [Candidatus Purcelliella pentastirinorum]
MNILYRKLARKRAVQALYSWQISNNNINDIEHHFLKITNNKIDIIYFKKIFNGVTNIVKELDEIIKLYILRNLNTLSLIEKTVLRISLYELKNCNEIPYKIIIDEGIELAKIFGSKNSYKFINGVLDKIVVKMKLKN